jgi:hypothetical protein
MALIGSQSVGWTDGSATPSTSITVPSGATHVLFLATWWRDASTSALSSISLTDGTLENSYDYSETGAFAGFSRAASRLWAVSSIGSKTLAATFAAAPEDGPCAFVVYLDEAPTVIDAEAIGNSGSDISLSVTLTGLNAGDFVFSVDTRDNNTTPPGNQSGWTSLQTAAHVLESGRLRYIEATGSSVTSTSQPTVSWAHVIATAVRFSSASGVDLVVQDSTHAHTVDSVVLSTGTSLAINDATHGHAVDNLTLTTTSTVSLTVQDSTHGHTVDSPGLTTDWLLEVQDSSHDHSADNVTLALATVVSLDAQDATHYHAADSVALVADSFLQVNDSIHGHTAENVTLEGEFGAIVGAPPGFFRPERRYLVEVNGNRYLVPESEIHKWVTEKTEEIVEKAQQPKKPKELRKLVKNTPKITTKADDSFVRELVAQANERIQQAILLANEQKSAQDDEDDLEILLLAI